MNEQETILNRFTDNKALFAEVKEKEIEPLGVDASIIGILIDQILKDNENPNAREIDKAYSTAKDRLESFTPDEMKLKAYIAGYVDGIEAYLLLKQLEKEGLL